MRFNKEEDRQEIEKEEALRKTLLSKAQISIMLNSYEDIFSDFDPRPYPIKALSDDFLIESKKAALDKHGALEVSFMIPKSSRNSEVELLIKKRLRDHFRKHYLLLKSEIGKIKRKGILMAIGGVLLIVFAAVILSLENQSWWTHFLIVLFEPAGWFTAWTGLDEMYYTTREKKPDLDFYQKMTQSDISFHSY